MYRSDPQQCILVDLGHCYKSGQSFIFPECIGFKRKKHDVIIHGPSSFKGALHSFPSTGEEKSVSISHCKAGCAPKQACATVGSPFSSSLFVLETLLVSPQDILMLLLRNSRGLAHQNMWHEHPTWFCHSQYSWPNQGTAKKGQLRTPAWFNVSLSD